MIKFLIKIWPSFLPILVYIFWTYIIEDLIVSRLMARKKVIDAEKVVGEKATEEQKFEPKVGKFSLQNPCFITTLYVSLAVAIFSLVMSAFS